MKTLDDFSEESYLLFHMDKCVISDLESTLVDLHKFYTLQSELSFSIHNLPCRFLTRFKYDFRI